MTFKDRSFELAMPAEVYTPTTTSVPMYNSEIGILTGSLNIITGTLLSGHCKIIHPKHERHRVPYILYIYIYSEHTRHVAKSLIVLKFPVPLHFR